VIYKCFLLAFSLSVKSSVPNKRERRGKCESDPSYSGEAMWTKPTQSCNFEKSAVLC